MPDTIPLINILFLDIETVPQKSSFDELDDAGKELWTRKAELLKKTNEDTPSSIYSRAGIYAEFGKIICISVGFFKIVDGQKQLRIKSFYGDDERTVLEDFAALLKNYFNRTEHRLCAHNGKEFDFAYLSRRMLINGIKQPALLDNAGKKPWEIQHLDTLELWKFGDNKNYTPLNLLAHIFGIKSPKDDIDGSMVWFVYWKDKDLQRIVTYCQKDVVTVAQIYLRMRGEQLLSTNDILIT